MVNIAYKEYQRRDIIDAMVKKQNMNMLVGVLVLGLLLGLGIFIYKQFRASAAGRTLTVRTPMVMDYLTSTDHCLSHTHSLARRCKDRKSCGGMARKENIYLSRITSKTSTEKD